MDARMDVFGILGLDVGDAHVIRNAGGRAIDALRSVVISQQLLGTREIIIVHHVSQNFGHCVVALLIIKQTDCGMLTFSDNDIRSKISTDLRENADHIAFLPFGDLKKSVVDDIQLLKKNSLVLDVPVTGYIYDVKTGKLEKVNA